MKYRSKPKTIEAVQWSPATPHPGVARDGDWYFVVTIHEQRVYLAEGDYIVMEPDGVHYYPVKPDIFLKSYEPADQDTSA
jgi:hypothetical protein